MTLEHKTNLGDNFMRLYKQLLQHTEDFTRVNGDYLAEAKYLLKVSNEYYSFLANMLDLTEIQNKLIAYAL